MPKVWKHGYMSDERANLPSASSFDRLYFCPGSRKAEQGLSELPKDDTTETGVRVHSAMETGSDDELEDMTEKDIAKALRAMEEREIAKFQEFYNLGAPVKIIREERFWIRDRRTLEILASARPDVVAIWPPDHGFVGNYKTGFKSVTPSQLSWQSRTEVLSLWQEHFNCRDITAIRGGFLASRLRSSCDTTDYTTVDLSRVSREFMHALWRIDQPDAPRIPGQWCRWCLANGVCREKAVYDQISGAQLPVVAGEPDQLKILDAIGRLTPHEMAYIYHRKASMEFAYDALQHRMKQLPENVLKDIGFKIVPGNKNREIVDTPTAFARLAIYLPDEDRMQAIKILRGKAAELLAERTGISKKSAQEQIDGAIGNALKEKPGQPKLREL